MPWYEYSTGLGGSRPRPLVEARLLHGARQVRVVALVDSGADMSLMDANYAAVLGLDRADAVVSTGIGAGGAEFTCLSWPTAPIEIQFDRQRFAFQGAFFEFDDDADGMNLLGRGDFFKQYIVQFWESAELMNIDLSPDSAHPPVT